MRTIYQYLTEDSDLTGPEESVTLSDKQIELPTVVPAPPPNPMEQSYIDGIKHFLEALTSSVDSGQWEQVLNLLKETNVVEAQIKALMSGTEAKAPEITD